MRPGRGWLRPFEGWTRQPSTPPLASIADGATSGRSARSGGPTWRRWRPKPRRPRRPKRPRVVPLDPVRTAAVRSAAPTGRSGHGPTVVRETRSEGTRTRVGGRTGGGGPDGGGGDAGGCDGKARAGHRGVVDDLRLRSPAHGRQSFGDHDRGVERFEPAPAVERRPRRRDDRPGGG